MITTGIKRLWHSPTVTSWANYAAQSMRLVVLLPLVLHRFDETQIAAWFLFGSLVFFITVVQDQLASLFSRMFALVMGGATDLSPIRSHTQINAGGECNWSLMRKLYETAASLNLAIATVGILITAAIGYFSFDKLLANYTQSALIWKSFGVILLGQFCLQALRKYAIVLRGLNYVALSNRWNVLLSLLSSTSGAIALLFGANIFWLAVVVEACLLLSILCMRMILHFVQPNFREYGKFALDSQIVRWLWPPLWRGLIQVMANRGGVRIGVVFLAREAPPATLAAVLLCLRLLETLEGISGAPVYSHVPRYCRLLGEGKLDELRKGLTHSIRQTLLLLSCGCVLIAYGIFVVLGVVAPQMPFISLGAYWGMAVGFCLIMFIRQTLIMPILGNHVVEVPRLSLSVVLSLVLAATLIPHYLVAGFIISAFVPSIALVNIRALRIGCTLLHIPMGNFLRRTTLIPALILICGIGLHLLPFVPDGESIRAHTIEIVSSIRDFCVHFGQPDTR